MKDKIVIPTPVECNFSGRKFDYEGFKIENASPAAPYALEMGNPFFREDGPSSMIFSELKYKNEQAYKISIEENRIIVYGAGPTAFIYAIATLLQLAEKKEGRIILPEGEIFDYPEFEIRGVNWNLFVECRGWSQDAGDGINAFRERFVNAMDILVFFKLNAVFADGFGWNKERFPGYGKLMRGLNHEAKRRGIKLIFGGYNAGYGAQWHDFDGPVFRNRISYPDGKIYPCIASEMYSETAPAMGTCLSNKVLLEEKKKNLCEFARNIEPGMLYIHGLDISSQAGAERAWASRCPECRKRWPSDAINAPDGMDGAFAEFYDELYNAVSSVKNNDSGYDASEDCIVNMVSPNYTNHNENDDEWKYHLDYFRTLSGCLKNKKIHLTLREQFFNNAESIPRFKQLRKAVGKEQKLSVVYFSSGSSYYNSLPVTADAACIRYFEGMNAVIAGSGNAFQEARQAICAEYMWNPAGTAFKVDLPKRGSNIDFLSCYHSLTDGLKLPESVFGADGLLNIVCSKLYGNRAGEIVSSIQRPELTAIYNPKKTFNRSGPAGSPTALAPLFPLTNEMLPGYHFSVFYKGGSRIMWRKGLTDDSMRFAESYKEIMDNIIRIGNSAADSYREAASLCKSTLPFQNELRAAHLNRMAETCSRGASLAGFVRRWLDILTRACKYRQKKENDSILEASIGILCQELSAFLKPLQDIANGTIDPNKADIGQAIRTVEFLLNDLNNIRHTFRTGEYLEIKTDSWW